MKISIRQLTTMIVLLICTPVMFAAGILKPGVTYEARKFVSNGDYLGISGPEYHSVEITIYNDGTARGVYKVSLKEFDGDVANSFNLKGSWGDASMYDKKLIQIAFFDTNKSLYMLYIDQNQNVYFDDINSSPTKLYNKSELDAEKNALELQMQAEQQRLKEEMAAREADRKRTYIEFAKIREQKQEYYEIVDLGLSVKWANLNYIKLTQNHDFERGCQLDYIGDGSLSNKYKPRDQFTFDKARSYYHKENGKVTRDLLYCSESDYFAGGKKFGEPIPTSKEHVREEFLYKYKKQYGKTTLTPPQTEELNKYSKAEHYPTTYEWKELMDNCYVAGVEEHSLKKDPAYIDYIKVHGQDSHSWGDFNMHGDEDYHNNRMLRLVSKINGNSIVLPFNLKTGTNYLTSQRLSADSDKCTCVHVDTKGLTFVEVDRKEDSNVTGRFVYGDIDLKALKEGIQKAKEEYKPYAIEQEKLAQEYEEQLMANVLILGAPIVETLEVGRTGESVKISIKAPIISGKATEDSRVLVYIDKDPFKGSVNSDSQYTANIIAQNGQNPAYIEYTKWVKSNTEHYFFFLSLNFPEKYYGWYYGRYYLDPQVFDFQKGFLAATNEYNGKTDRREYKYYQGLGISNKFDKIDRRFVKQSSTYFSVSDKKRVTYISGPQPPAPKIGAPYVINLGEKKGKNKVTYQNVEVGFSVEEENYPFDHPQAEDYSMSVMKDGKDLKLIDCGISGNVHRYIIKKIEAMVPYSFEGIVWCQHLDRYSNKVELIVDNNGNVTTKDINSTKGSVQ